MLALSTERKHYVSNRLEDLVCGGGSGSVGAAARCAGGAAAALAGLAVALRCFELRGPQLTEMDLEGRRVGAGTAHHAAARRRLSAATRDCDCYAYTAALPTFAS